MLGTPTEHRLLDALLRDNGQVVRVRDRVVGTHFSHPSLGAVFDGICMEVGRGQRINLENVSDYLEPWGTRGVGYADPFGWSKADTIPGDAAQLADIIRAIHVRTEGRRILLEAGSDLNDGSIPADFTLTQTVELLQRAIDANSSATLESRSLAEILQGEDTYDWVIPHLLEKGERMVVTGAEGGGKTTLLRQLAIGAAGGIHPLSRRPMQSQQVLVIDAENSEAQWRRKTRWIVQRYLALGAVPDVAQRVQVYAGKRFDITRPATLSELHRLVDRVKPSLMFIGPLYRLVPHAIQTDDEAAPLISALDQFRDRGITLVMEAHAGKATDASGDRGLAPRGSSALLGWPEFGFGLRPSNEDPGLVSLVRWRGDRDEREWPTHFYRGLEGDLPWMPSR